MATLLEKSSSLSEMCAEVFADEIIQEGNVIKIIMINRGAWVAQSDKSPTLDFCSGHDLTVHGFKPHVRPPLAVGSLLGILGFSSLSAPPLLTFCLSLSLSQK